MRDDLDPGTGELPWPELRDQTVSRQVKGKQLDEHGREVLDPTPVAPPVGYKRSPSMVDHIRNMVKSEMLRQAAESADMESFEDADDFEVDDDPDPYAPYEAEFEPPAPLVEPPEAAGGPAAAPAADERPVAPAPAPSPATAPPSPSAPT